MTHPNRQTSHGQYHVRHQRTRRQFAREIPTPANHQKAAESKAELKPPFHCLPQRLPTIRDNVRLENSNSTFRSSRLRNNPNEQPSWRSATNPCCKRDFHRELPAC